MLLGSMRSVQAYSSPQSFGGLASPAKLCRHFCESHRVRFLPIAIMAFILGAGATLVQTGIAASPPSGAAPGSRQVSPSLTTVDLLSPLRLLPTSASSATSPIPSTMPLGETLISPQRRSPNRPQSRQDAHDSAVADCMQMWDFGTHMTKQAWLRTCKRIETRLDKLNVDAVMPNAKTTSQKKQVR